MFELRKYHGDRVQSLTYDDGKMNFSVGILAPGEYEFGAIKKEITTVNLGKITVWTEDTNEWKTYGKGETFEVNTHKNFKLKVDEVSAYICFYE